MAEISRFFGIRILMRLQDHPPPHVHAQYGDDDVSVSFEPGIVVQGRMSKRALLLIFEWVELHRDELKENWERVRAGLPPVRIAPLV